MADTMTPPPAPDTSSLLALTAQLAAANKLIASQSILAAKNLKFQTKNTRVQGRNTTQELSALQAQIAALNVQPDPTVQSLSSPEVQQARRQTAIDAAGNNGMRASILGGAPTRPTFSGSSGAPRPSIIAPVSDPRGAFVPPNAPAAWSPIALATQPNRSSLLATGATNKLNGNTLTTVPVKATPKKK